MDEKAEDCAADPPTTTHLHREALTMGLYLSIVLGAVLAGGDDTHRNQVGLLWGSGIGLGVAHIFAFRLAATVLRPDGKPTRADGMVTAVIASTVATICAIASIPFLIWNDTGQAVDAAGYLLLTLVGLIAFTSERRAGAPLLRTLVFAALAVVTASALVVLKNSLGH